MTAGGVTLRAHLPGDDAAIVELWNAAAGDRYPLRDRLWRQLTADNPDFRSSDLVVAVDGPPEGPARAAAPRPLVGFGYLGRARSVVLGRRAWPSEGWLQVVAVTPGRRRQGIGRAIVERLLADARAEGLERVLIAGGVHYLFPGAPLDLPEARTFLAACSARFEHETYDVRGTLDGRATLDRDRAALAAAGLAVRAMDAAEGSTLLAFLEREFGPDWVYDQDWAASSGMAPDDIVLLVGADRAGPPVAAADIAGFATIHRRGPGPLFGPRFWEDLLEPASGGLGPIGVAARLRGRGLGRALLAVALDTLHARGVRDCVIDWTTLLDYYGPFGFRIWKTYLEGELPL